MLALGDHVSMMQIRIERAGSLTLWYVVGVAVTSLAGADGVVLVACRLSLVAWCTRLGLLRLLTSIGLWRITDGSAHHSDECHREV